MIKSETIGNEVYVYIFFEGKKELLYKRWLNYGYGKVFDKFGPPFSAKDVESKKVNK